MAGRFLYFLKWMGNNQLLEKYADWISKENKQRCYDTACHYDDIEIFNIFRRFDVNLLGKYSYLISLFSEKKDIKILQDIINDNRIDLTTGDNEFIRKACHANNLPLVKLLLETGRVDPSSRHNYCLNSAVDKGNTEMVNLLFKDPRVNIKNDLGYTFKNCIFSSYNDILEILLEKYNPENIIDELISYSIKYQKRSSTVVLLRWCKQRTIPFPKNISFRYLSQIYPLSKVRVRKYYKQLQLQEYITIYYLNNNEYITTLNEIFNYNFEELTILPSCPLAIKIISEYL